MSLMYTQMPLDRCTNQRKSPTWLKSQFNSTNALFCLVHEGENFFSRESPLNPLFLNRQQLPSITLNSCIFLGKSATQSLFAIDSNKLNFTVLEKLNALGEWQSLRNLGAVIDYQDSAILALAKGLVHWHKTHLYCGKCGALNQLVEAGHARRCSSNSCRNMTFPRTDPAVIMLVERMFADGVARCLLGRQASWPAGVYSTLAGFVDPGENLEEAVIREVAEESGINAHQAQYVASQPWPFPASVMLGFIAVGINEEVDITHDDLESAQWFSREQLAGFTEKEAAIKSTDSTEPTLKPAKGGYVMSSKDSISHYLITAWKNQQIGQY
ncbi:MAG: NAD+ diphosphatase [Oceanospirillaceae bacterium]|jgi:NAD+ diphosphatase